MTDLKLLKQLPAELSARITINPSGCWIWLGAQARGYGHASGWRYGSAETNTHRLVFALLVGPIPEGFLLHHACFRQLCCNPDHMRLVRPSEHSRFHNRPPEWEVTDCQLYEGKIVVQLHDRRGLLNPVEFCAVGSTKRYRRADWKVKLHPKYHEGIDIAVSAYLTAHSIKAVQVAPPQGDPDLNNPNNEDQIPFKE